MAYLQNRVVVVNRMRTAQLLPRLRGSNLNRQVELISKNSSVLAFSEPNEMNVGINAEMNVEMKRAGRWTVIGQNVTSVAGRTLIRRCICCS